MSNRRPPEYEPGKDIVPVSATNGHGSKVPAPQYRNFFASFKALTDAFDEQIKIYDELCSAWQGRNHRVDFYYEGDDVDSAQDLWTIVREGAVQCLEDLEQLRAMRYQSTDIYHPSAEFLMWRIGEMMKVWPDKLSGEPGANYAEYIAEHLAAKDLNVMVWESVFLDFEENQKTKPPALAEMLELMDKHKRRWERRLAAIDLVQINKCGEALVFAHEFKNTVFKEAVLEYLDAHGYTDLATGVRDGELRPHAIAIKATARTEGLSELVAKMEAPVTTSEVFEEAKRILISEKHVRSEWELLPKNAQRRVNKDKPFVCNKCGAGYKDWSGRCVVCDGNTLVSHKVWDEQIACEQKELQAKLQDELQQQQDKLQQRQREQKRREKLEWFLTAQLSWDRAKEQREERQEQRFKKELKEADCRFEERKWGVWARSQQIEDALWNAFERQHEKYWTEIALEYDFWSEMSKETYAELKKNGIRHLTDKELAQLRVKAKRELAEREDKEKRDKALHDLQDLQDQLREQGEEVRELRDRTWQESLELIPDLLERLQEQDEEIRELRDRIGGLEYNR